MKPRKDLTNYEKKLLFIAHLKLPENAVRYEDWRRRQREYCKRNDRKRRGERNEKAKRRKLKKKNEMKIC